MDGCLKINDQVLNFIKNDTKCYNVVVLHNPCWELLSFACTSLQGGPSTVSGTRQLWYISGGVADLLKGVQSKVNSHVRWDRCWTAVPFQTYSKQGRFSPALHTHTHLLPEQMSDSVSSYLFAVEINVVAQTLVWIVFINSQKPHWALTGGKGAELQFHLVHLKSPDHCVFFCLKGSMQLLLLQSIVMLFFFQTLCTLCLVW